MKSRILLFSLAVIMISGCLSGVGSQNEKETKTTPSKKAEKERNRTTSSIIYSDKYNINLGGLEKTHAFDIHKYKRIYDQLILDKLITPSQAQQPNEISETDILRVQTKSFLESLKSSTTIATYLEAPVLAIVPAASLDKHVLEPFRYATGGTLLAARQSLKHGIGINLSGGYHHAKPDSGEGFCIYADVPIAIRTLQDEGVIKRALIIDLDVHQGNGTAVCLAEDDTTFCFSIHQGDIYPQPKEKSDLDVEIEAGTNNEEYMELLKKHLPTIFEKSGTPDIVFYVAGCDTLKDDPLASVNMTEDGIVERDRIVIDACVKRKIPVVMTLSGGYSENAWHAQYSSIKSILKQYQPVPKSNQK